MKDPIPHRCHKMIAEMAGDPGVGRVSGDSTESVRARQHAKWVTLASKNGVTLADAETALMHSASRLFAEDWVKGCNTDAYRLEYSIRHGACEVWGLVVRLLREARA